MSELNIFDPADGLLETHVTWDHVEKALQEAFDTQATLGPNRTIENLADGVGFSSMIGLITADWNNVEMGKELPRRFVVKMSTCIHGKRVSLSQKSALVRPDNFFHQWANLIRSIHNTECEFFDQINARGHGEVFKLPKVFHARKFSDNNDVIGFELMECIEDAHTFHLYNNLKTNQIEQVLEELAKIQAFFLKSDIGREKDLVQPHVSNFYNHLLPAERFKEIFAGLKRLGDPEMASLIGKISERLGDFYHISLLDVECEKRGMRPVLIHGDLWATNFLFDNASDDLKCLIDFQLSHHGSPAYDLLRILITCLSGEERRKQQEKLIAKYYESLISNLDGYEPPFTLEQLKASYYHLFPLCAVANSAMFGPILMYAISKVTDGTARNQILENVFEKMKVMYADALDYENKEIYRIGHAKI